MAQQHGADAAQGRGSATARHAAAARAGGGRGRCRGRRPRGRRGRSGRAAPRGLPWSTRRPWRSISTWCASRSTSPMLCEASSTVACVRGLVALEMAAQLVGGVGVERGRGLVEQQQLGLVDQRLGEQHAGLLPGRQPAERAVEEGLEVEVARRAPAMRSLRPRDGVELGVDAQVLRAPSAAAAGRHRGW